MPQHDPAQLLEAELAAAVTTGVKPTDYAQPHVRAAAAGENFGRRTTSMWDTLADGAHKFLDVETPPNKPAA